MGVNPLSIYDYGYKVKMILNNAENSKNLLVIQITQLHSKQYNKGHTHLGRLQLPIQMHN